MDMLAQELKKRWPSLFDSINKACKDYKDYWGRKEHENDVKKEEEGKLGSKSEGKKKDEEKLCSKSGLESDDEETIVEKPIIQERAIKATRTQQKTVSRDVGGAQTA